LAGRKENIAPEEIPDLGTDREQGLSNSFEDPGIEEFLPEIPLDFSAPAGPSLAEEAVAAVNDLILEAKSEREEAHDRLGQMAVGLFALVAGPWSFAELAERILAQLQAAVGAEAASLLELDNEKREFFFRASIGGGDPEKIKSFRVAEGQGIVGKVAASGKPLLLRSPRAEEIQLNAVSLCTGYETHGCLAAPLSVGGKLYGVLEFFNKKGGEFTEADLSVLTEGAVMAAKILEIRFLLAALAKRMR
jgi:transcriptional regulator with GAF, ATPase, and Fis domain